MANIYMHLNIAQKHIKFPDITLSIEEFKFRQVNNTYMHQDVDHLYISIHPT